MTEKEKKLKKLVEKYCKQKNLIENEVWKGILKYGPLPDPIIDNIIKYYKSQ